jgi:septal ring factor EnvC (AmiA/AmiB activator)
VSLADIARLRPRGRGQHRAIDRVTQLEAELQQERAVNASLRRQLNTAKDGWDKANAKASQYREQRDRAVEATRQNQQAVSSLTTLPELTETQPIRVLTLPEADRWGYLR